jgi:hypothetical protein
MVLIDMGLCVYGLYVVTNGSEGLIGQDFPRLGRERGFHSAIYCYWSNISSSHSIIQPVK